MCFGFGGNAYRVDKQLVLQRGEQTVIGAYTLRNDGVKVSSDDQKQMVTGYIAVFRDGAEIDVLYPAKWYYRRHEREPTTEAAIRRSIGEDLHVALLFNPADLATETAALQAVINPLVDWIWVGFGVLMLGGGIALLH